MVRKLKLQKDYARALAIYRSAMFDTLKRNKADYSPALARKPRVHLEELERVEERIGHTVPDWVVAWLAAGLANEGKWGAKRAPGITYVEGLTLQWRDSVDDSPIVNFDVERFGAFDYDNADYYLYEVGVAEPVLHYFDHESGFTELPFKQDPIDMLARWMADTLESMANLDDYDPLEVEVFSEPKDLSSTRDTNVGRRVSHPKFGRGRVKKALPGKKPKYVVEFESYGEKKLLGSFLNFE